MAIFHASTKPISRSSGRSAVAAAAYRSGEKLLDQRTGKEHDFTKKRGVVSSEIIAPFPTYGLAIDRNNLWNKAEAAEKRKDARTAREWVLALPAELGEPWRREVAMSFAQELVNRYGVAVDVAIHEPDKKGDNRNHHAHLLVTTRQISQGDNNELIVGEKATIELSDKKRREMGLGSGADEIEALREIWANKINNALEQNSSFKRVDHRSLERQGIDREPTTHLGPVATAMERQGKASNRGDDNRAAIANNMLRKLIEMRISLEKAAEKLKDIGENIYRKIKMKELDKSFEEMMKKVGKNPTLEAFSPKETIVDKPKQKPKKRKDRDDYEIEF